VYNAGVRIAILATLHRPHALEIVRRTICWLKAHGQSVHLSIPLAAAVGHSEYGMPEAQAVDSADMVIAIGGDGTMLGAVRAAAPAGVPVLGVNAGALGFLTELTPDDLATYLPQILEGAYTLEPRMMLEASLHRDQAEMHRLYALNDVVVRQGANGRMIVLQLRAAGHTLGEMGADGLILSTPTGSTAYGLAAGGPVIHPSASVMLLVPICPHSLSFRPLVVPAGDPIEVICRGNQHGDAMMVTTDGQEPLTVQTDDRLVVRPAPYQALLVKFGRSSYYDRLREKLQWGGNRG